MKNSYFNLIQFTLSLFIIVLLTVFILKQFPVLINEHTLNDCFKIIEFFSLICLIVLSKIILREYKINRLRILLYIQTCFLNLGLMGIEESKEHLDLILESDPPLKNDLFFQLFPAINGIESFNNHTENYKNEFYKLTGKKVKNLEMETGEKEKSSFNLLGVQETNSGLTQRMEKLDALPKLAPSDMYQLLGVDVLTIYIGENLIPIADIEIGGELIENIGNLRQYLTLTQGFILPTVRICDAKFLKPNEYQILVRGNVVASSLVHIDRYFILKRHWDKSFDTPLKDAIEGCEPNLKEAAYWIDKTEIDNLVKENKWTQPYETASEAITYHIAETASLYIDQLLTKVEVRKILDQVSHMDPGLVDGIVPTLLTVSEIRKILVNLLREKVSIRDIHFILEKLEDLALEIRTIDVLSERLRILLSRQICVQYADDKTIKAISLSSEIEKKMEDSIQVIDNEVLLGLEKEFAKKIVDKISALRNQIQNNSIVICPQVIRLPLARLLQAFDKRIVVMSPLEICPEFIVEIIGTIEIDS